MSVTFHPTKTPTAELCELRYWCDMETTTVTADVARDVAHTHSITCSECGGYGGVLVDEVHDFVTVNLANGNAARVMQLLGYTGDDIYCGSAAVDDFLGRLLVADGLLETSDERAPQTFTGHRGATLIDLGERAGYLNEKISLLIDLANWAKANNSDICWG
jgi:hypothetical protein